MKIWTYEHTFEHDWETIVKSHWKKYPHPLQPAILGTDVLSRHVDRTNGVLHSYRVLQSDWGLPQWAQSLIGANRVCCSLEQSTVNPRCQTMEMRSINTTFANFVQIRERLTYERHPEDGAKTVLRQQTEVTVEGVPFTPWMESIVVSLVSENAGKGRAAIESVAGRSASTSNLGLIRAGLEMVADKVDRKLIKKAERSLRDLEKKKSKNA